ncbi:peptidase S16 with C-terminal Lon domain [Gottschalkia acidurici 9a]|uniref:endopeptidase La n=1 Tax=Gottschalkia acidurici (strain ATCC 7906 / DSM 604 / BCRC 14475 / CIP 104303 / KCTC 5404 / NCIMB 10678 / 9a) TaxID=1128398 RepID=K0B4Q3_GOTA9|nr:ATP-binding protein [Gottschalkia acidurici]AFS79551.1 peptidase S16 with C-terminal Lon domain [Gottschalkia acidurici 9a]
MLDKYKISAKELEHKCETDCFNFETTKELDILNEIIGQDRALEALDFGLKVNKKGYNIFVAGESGTGRSSYASFITNEMAKHKDTPSDWIYVYNFKTPHKPIALSLKKGLGKEFVKDIESVVSTLMKEIKNTFSSKDYENLRNQIVNKYDNEYEIIMNEIDKKAEEHGFRFDRLEDNTVISVPIKDGKALTESEMDNLSQSELEEFKNKSKNLSIDTIELFNKLRILGEVLEEDFKKLDKETGNKLTEMHISKLKAKYKEESIRKYLIALQEDIVANIDSFKNSNEEKKDDILGILDIGSQENTLDRYEVNLFMDNSEIQGAPVIFETNPTYYNLVGSIEYTNEMGVMKTDFTHIKPGALHMANGGYLILQAKDLLLNSFAWQALKRSLITDEINIESLEGQLGYVVTSTLKPQPIPLDLKVILIGDYYTYDLLYNNDEDFRKLFKVMSDFDIEMNKEPENLIKMARFIATNCQKEGLKHFNREAVCKVLEYSSRLAENKNKLSSKFNQIVEIIYEADYWATKEGSEIVSSEHVRTALDKKTYRNNKYEVKTLEMFAEEDYLLDVDGEKVGEINGLAVVGTGEYAFGKPSKITVSTYIGKSGIINIEREVKTSGKIHDKGVMIISGYLGEKYAKDKPLSLNASVVFEQLYSGVDGDSASSTELYAILSSISEIPIRQCIAVTGSVNQRGEIQPIGGVNEKIEGFFKVCKLKGLTGKQGVMIPHQNVKNLMLNDEVIEAVNEGQFSIYSVRTIDEGIEVLTGMSPEKVHHLVNEKLEELANLEYKK